MPFSYEIMSHEPYICPECGYREGTAFDEAEEELDDEGKIFGIAQNTRDGNLGSP